MAGFPRSQSGFAAIGGVECRDRGAALGFRVSEEGRL